MGFFDSLLKKSSDERSVLDLIQIVKSDPKGRYEALVSLKKIGNRNAIDTFYKMLNDPSPRIRRISIEALGEMGDTTAINSLANLINTNDFSPTGKRTNFGHTENIILAKEAIRKIQQRSNTPEGIKTEILQSPPHLSPLNNGENWTNEDIQVLRQFWGEGKFIQVIVNRLNRSADSVVHKLIETGLIGYNDDNCYPKPARFGFTWSEQERTQLLSELKSGKNIPEIANIHQRNKNSILHTMISMKTFNYHDRSLLEKYKEKSVPPDTNQLIRTLISELENNSNSDVRNSAATQLGSFHEPSVVNALIKCVKNDPKVRYRALAALRNIGDPLGIPVFIERSKDRSVRIRLVSVNALGELGDSNVVKHLESHINSKDYQNALKNGGNPEIIQAAREAIQKIHSREPSVESDLIEKPILTISLDSTQLSAGRSHKLGVTFTNTGLSDVESVLLAFSSEFETKGIKPISVKAGQSSRTDISIIPKYVGNILLEITLTYKDIKDREYKTVQEFWIEVIEKGTTTSPLSETPSSPVSQFTPRPLTQKQLPLDLSDRYTESEFIGKGGFARVFKAKRKDGKFVAVKIPISMDAMTGKSFIAEMQNWTKLSHPNIVTLYDFNIMPMPFFEEELCDSALSDQEKPLESEEASWILFNICEGLKFAHTQKIIHRDLKPQNILLKNGVPKISDWGLSRIISESTTTTTTSFTAYYAAPEQIGNKAKDERTDIWQIGVIFYELVTGLLPFTGDSMVEVMAAIVSKNPTLPSLINSSSQNVESMIIKCLEKNPSKRYQSVLELQKDLALYLRVTYTESLKMSVTAHDNNRSAHYCGDLVMINMSTGDMTSAYNYLRDLVYYSKGEMKVDAQELSEQIKMRMEMGLTEIPDELIQKAKIIIHHVKIGSDTK